MIDQETIQRIMDASRIEEVIGDFVSLKKRGSNHIGCCPFHNEKTPSFYVSPSKGIYKCFGCGEAGDVVKFLMKHEHYTYPEALRWLAEKYHIEIREEELTEEQKERQTERRHHQKEYRPGTGCTHCFYRSRSCRSAQRRPRHPGCSGKIRFRYPEAV